jgi:hypothetical protein
MNQGHAPGVTFDKCPKCGGTVSAIAVQCPHCSHPLTQAPEPKKRGRGGLVLLGVVALVAGLAAGAYFASPVAREAIKAAAIAIGIPITSWEDRAKVVASNIYDQRGTDIAANVLRIMHPAGKEPQLAAYGISVEAGQLVSRFEVSWQLSGGTINITSIEWRCSRTGHVSARLAGENGTNQPSSRNSAQLDDYFGTELYPLLVRNIK